MKAHEHLSDARLMELGSDAAISTRNGEAAHLASCERCAARLAVEKELTVALSSLGESLPPFANFSSHAVSRFESETRARSRRRAFWTVAGAVLCASVLGLVAWVFADVLAAELAGDLAFGASMWRAVRALGSAMPAELLVATVVSMGVVLVGASFALFALWRSGENARLVQRSGPNVV